jgi:hypothetical protein
MNARSIFQIAASEMFAEDKFTAALTYLIDNIPEVGQAFASLLAKGSGLRSPTFIRAEDHPEGDAESKPDFVLHCKQFDILCEHKLDSKLGQNQLERYLKLWKKDGRTRVALITNWDTPEAISEKVLSDADYLRPIRSKVPYFSWQSLYPIVADRPERLAKEFAVYMRGMGMAPTLLPKNWNDLFTDQQARIAFQEITRNLKDHFKKMCGATCKGDGGKLGVQIQHPTPWLHLIYIYVSKTTTPFEADVSGPFIAARIFINKEESMRLANFDGRKAILNSRIGLIIGRQVKESVSWNKDLELAYEYVANLNGYLTDDASDSGKNLLEFGRAIFEDVSKIAQ